MATPSEAALAAELQLRSSLEAYRHIFAQEAPTPTLERLHSLWESWLESAVFTAFVAEMASRPLGVVLAGADPSEALLGHVARMYVAPECWGQGIGRLLHGTAIEHLRGGL